MKPFAVLLAACSLAMGLAFPAQALDIRPYPSDSLRPSSAPVRPVASPDPYQGAIATLRQKLDAEKALPLQDGERSVLMTHPTRPARGTIVMYHGFAAGPWQFQPLADKAFADGYNVYIPRLPGHGLLDSHGVEDPSGLVTGKNWPVYAQFGESTFQDVKALGGPVSAMGLSVGGAISLSVAERHPELQKEVAFAPFLRPIRGGMMMDLVHGLDWGTSGQAGRLLNVIPFGWGAESTKQTAAGLAHGGRAGHSRFNLGNIYAAAEFGRQVVQDADKIKAPVQFFTSGADDAVDMGAIQTIYTRSGGAAKNAMYEYPKAEGIPHPMISPLEDLGKGHTPRLFDMTMQFLENGMRNIR